MKLMKNLLRQFGSLTIIAFCLSTIVPAQSATATLSGTVTDENSAVVANANVAVRRGAIVVRTTQTDESGRFTFNNLTPELLNLTVTASGFSLFSQTVEAANFGTDVAVALKIAALGEIVEVRDRPAAIYAGSQVSAATKVYTPILEVPQSVQVINRELIEDRRPVTLSEVLFNVSGLSDFGSRRAFDNINIRGLPSVSTIFLDGLRVERGNRNVQQELYGLERIEVLKGPNSALYGQSSPGGTITQISKRPLDDFHGNIELSYGRFNFLQPTIDITGPMNREKTVNYRVNFVYRDQGDFVDFNDKRRFYLSPALGVKISDSTQLTLLSNYTRDRHDGAYTGLPAEGSILPRLNGQISRRLYAGEPNFDGVEIERIQAGYIFDHRFNQNFGLRQVLRYTDTDVESRATFRNGSPQPNPNLINRSAARFKQTEGVLAVDTNAETRFRTGRVRHTVIFGFDYFIQNIDQTFGFGGIAPLNVYQPVYGQQPTPLTLFFNLQRRDQLLGFYAQGQFNFFERLTLTVGGRVDRTNTRNLNRNNNLTTRQDVTSTTPRVGLTYQITDGVAIYGSYTRSFEPQFGTTFTNAQISGSPFEPELGEQYEGGIKTAAFNSRLISTFAVFNLKRKNVLVADPVNFGFQVQTGEQRSRGFEADVAFQILPNWNVIGAYTNTEVQVTRDTTIPVGNSPVSIPRNQASFWSNYQIDRSFLKGLGLGLGLRYVGTREGTLPNTFKLPDYATVDSSLIYRRENWRFQLNVFNLMNKKDYYVSASPTGFRNVFPGEPINVRTTVGYQW